MAFGKIHIPLPSTHSHTQKHHQSSSSDHSPSPGHLPHATTLPTTLDTHSHHKHYHNREPHHTASNPLGHFPTNISPASYLSKHQHEYTVQHSFRGAKRAASLSHSSSQIPEYRSSSPANPTKLTALTTNSLTTEPLSLTTSQQDLADQQRGEQEQARKEHIAQDQAAWEAIIHAREAAARRSTIDANEQERPHLDEYQKMSEGSVRTANSRDGW